MSAWTTVMGLNKIQDTSDNPQTTGGGNWLRNIDTQKCIIQK